MNRRQLPRSLRRGVLVVVFAGTPVLLSAQAGLRSHGVVAGRVTDALTGDPVAGATVAAAETAVRVDANRKGEFVLRELPAGRVTLVVSAPEFDNERTDLTIDQAATTRVEIALLPSLHRMTSVHVELLGEADRRAVDRQRAAPNITTVIAADQLGRLSDGNAAEALQSVAGVAVRLSDGEGHDVQVRGAAPRLNSVTLNGERLPSTHGDKRSVDLDVIPADLLQTVEVAKTVLPSADADAIGGSVNLSMREIPRHTAWAASVAGGYDELSRGSGQASGGASAGGRLLAGRLGLFAAASATTASRGIEEVLASYSAAGPNEVGISKSLVERHRSGFNAATDYQLSENATVFLHGAAATYEVSSDQQTLRYVRSPGRTVREFLDERRDRTIAMASARGQQFLRLGTAIDYRLSLGYGRETRPRDLAIDFAHSEPVDLPPVTLATTTVGRADNPAAFGLSGVGIDTEFSRDRDVDGVTNLTLPIPLGSGSVFKTGVKYRTKTKSRNEDSFEETVNGPATLADFSTPDTAFFGSIGPFVDPILANTLVDRLDLVERAGANVSDYRATEGLLATYAMVEVPLSSRLAVLPGVRYEHSSYDYEGRGFDGMSTWPLTSVNRIAQWLPNVHVRYAADNDTIVRAAVTRTFARPDFEDLVPYETRRSGRVSSGNPLLRPTVAWNADVAVERYTRPLGLVSVAFFAKRLDDYIYSFRTASTVGGVPVVVTQPQNGDAATIAGVELTVRQQLGMLPAPLDSIVAYASYTRAASDARYPQRTGSDLPLPGQTPHLGNVVLSYERGGFSGRVAVNVLSSQIDRVGRSEQDDEHVAARTHVDLSIAQLAGHRTWFVFDVRNLTDAPDAAFGPDPGRPSSLERYGRYVTFGLRKAF